jgi:hypothetical protein
MVVFVWTRRPLNRPLRRLSARAESEEVAEVRGLPAQGPKLRSARENSQPGTAGRQAPLVRRLLEDAPGGTQPLHPQGPGQRGHGEKAAVSCDCGWSGNRRAVSGAREGAGARQAATSGRAEESGTGAAAAGLQSVPLLTLSPSGNPIAPAQESVAAHALQRCSDAS